MSDLIKDFKNIKNNKEKTYKIVSALTTNVSMGCKLFN